MTALALIPSDEVAEAFVELSLEASENYDSNYLMIYCFDDVKFLLILGFIIIMNIHVQKID
jgi:hypothetical protein